MTNYSQHVNLAAPLPTFDDNASVRERVTKSFEAVMNMFFWDIWVRFVEGDDAWEVLCLDTVDKLVTVYRAEFGSDDDSLVFRQVYGNQEGMPLTMTVPL